MASECAVIGTPAIYVNSLNAGTLQDQEKYGLIFNLRDDQTLVTLISPFLVGGSLKKEDTRQRSKKMLLNKVDVTDFVLRTIEDAN